MELFLLDLPDGINKDFQIALVDDPAIERDWITFAKQPNQFNFSTDGDCFKLISRNFSIESEDKRIISGYAMIADLEIPRYDEIRGSYNVVFRKEAIEKIWLNFQRNNLNTNTNIMHQTNQFAKGVFVCESIFVDSERGAKAHEGFTNEADGSWFISMKIENDEVWQQVKEGKFKGFSIEGRFTEQPDNFTKITNIIKQNKMDKPTLKQRLKDYFSTNPDDKIAVDNALKFEKAMLVDGVTEVTIEPAIEVGAAIVMTDAEGKPIPAPIGEYELSDGRVIVVAVEGVIAEIKEVEAGEDPEVVTEEPMGDQANQEQKVKRIIESIVSEKVFASQKEFQFLKEENEVLKKENTDLKAEFEAFKTAQNEAFESLKKFSKEIFDELLDEPIKAPVKEKFDPFNKGTKKNMFHTNN